MPACVRSSTNRGISGFGCCLILVKARKICPSCTDAKQEDESVKTGLSSALQTLESLLEVMVMVMVMVMGTMAGMGIW